MLFIDAKSLKLYNDGQLLKIKMKSDIKQLTIYEGNQKQLVDLFDCLDAKAETIANYKRSVVRFLDYIKANGSSETSLLDFKRELADNPSLSISSKNMYITAAKTFLKIAHSKGYIPTDMTLVNGMPIKTFGIGKLHKKDGLTEEELSRVVKYINDLDDNFKGVRIKLMFSLLFAQGLRQIEVSRLLVGDIDIKHKKAYIHGKGRDDKEPITLHDSVVLLLKKYLKLSNRKDGHLFYALTGYNAGQKLDPSGIKKIMTGIFKQLDIDKTTHALRHSFVNQLLKYYDDLLVVANYSRHANLSMIKVYADELDREADRPRFNEAFEKMSVG